MSVVARTLELLDVRLPVELEWISCAAVIAAHNQVSPHRRSLYAVVVINHKVPGANGAPLPAWCAGTLAQLPTRNDQR